MKNLVLSLFILFTTTIKAQVFVVEINEVDNTSLIEFTTKHELSNQTMIFDFNTKTIRYFDDLNDEYVLPFTFTKNEMNDFICIHQDSDGYISTYILNPTLLNQKFIMTSMLQGSVIVVITATDFKILTTIK